MLQVHPPSWKPLSTQMLIRPLLRLFSSWLIDSQPLIEQQRTSPTGKVQRTTDSQRCWEQRHVRNSFCRSDFNNCLNVHFRAERTCSKSPRRRPVGRGQGPCWAGTALLHLFYLSLSSSKSPMNNSSLLPQHSRHSHLTIPQKQTSKQKQSVNKKI